MLSSDLNLMIATARKLPKLGMIIIDPVTNYLGPEVKMNAEEEIRALLMPLTLAAAELRIVVLTIGHLNRRERGTEAMHRIMGAGPPPDSWKPRRSSDASKAIKKSCC